jgi:hypothetical protein
MSYIRRSMIRFMYSSTVQVTRLGMGGGPGIVDGAAEYTWVKSTDIIDPYWGIPGQMKCRLDLQFVRPGLNAPMPAEAGSVIPRAGTLFCDIPEDLSFIRAGDILEVIAGAYEGATFEITAIPELAQDVLGPVHMEAQIVEKAIQTGSRWPGVEPGDITR